MSDVLDILDVERPQTPEISKEAILGDRKKKKKLNEATFKRPEGMHRELYALLYSDKKGESAPLFLTDGDGYKQTKAKLGSIKRPRPWKWMPFTNPARKDGAVFHHWKRVEDEGEEYPFAKFNKSVPILQYSDEEYVQHLQCDGWSRQETDHLYDLCRRFDLRFVVIQDRWSRKDYAHKTVEDLKERYYHISNTLAKVRGGCGVKCVAYDGEHERRRKEQLIKLYERTPEQVEEEQSLLNELRKIELRKKEREKKTQDLQKLITAADHSSCNTAEQHSSRRQHMSDSKRPKKKMMQQKNVKANDNAGVDSAGIKFADFKGSGVTLRSQRMKLPASVGQKKAKAIEQLLKELDIDPPPIPTEDVCCHFNELRSDMVLLYELKLALSNCNFDIETHKRQNNES